ncbi:2-keto-4-pentenoate hydratase [Microlunatus elymi]|uniref:2-keto-4-pentenoate hydratase n=1 Tax=Microlunatus elymi TaxID=2596828 RepID=A0A516PYX5_9ACTN|nr:2-keto-4-pentenoate hydratase [Microlunatus elymi]QDP96364.1 2-keto-4-pentenoate hydratase [Microlunatus elymi]
MNATQLAQVLVDARRSATGLTDYPGRMPTDLDQAYAIQDAAMSLWPDEPVGWKAGLIAPQFRTPGGDERLIGPIWSRSVRLVGDADSDTASATELELPVYADGFAAVEAEFVVRLDAPAPAGGWNADEVAALPHTVFAGIEIASSPFPGINDHGPAVTASDFGNNAGLVVGAQLPADADPSMIGVRTELDGEEVGHQTGAAIPGGVLTSVAQTLSILGRRGRSVPAGTWFATGAVTGVHVARVGQSARISFGELPALRCRLVPADAA